MRKFFLKTLFAALIFLLVETVPIRGAVAPHSHTNQHTTKERVEDGIYKARDVDHLGEEEHNFQFDHEAIIGSQRGAEEYHNLPPAEAKRRLLELVKLMDLNSDGYITRHELKAWILRSFKKLTEEEAEEMFRDYDDNEDNQVTWNEFLKSKDFESKDPEDSHDAELLEDDKEMFHAADLNGDGALSFEEYVLFQAPEEHPAMLPTVMNQTLRHKDKNSDGEISFQEYIDEAGVERDREMLLAERDRFDNEHDQNHDGVLKGHEILQWAVPNNTQIAEDEVDHLFASTDADHDDLLSYEEILDNFDIFVGSEATDYGSHLENLDDLSDIHTHDVDEF